LELVCTTEIVDGVATIHLSGEADLGGVETMRAAGSETIGNPAARSVVVDCAGLTFCDSTVLSVLISWRNQTLEVGCPLMLERVPRQLRKILQITGLDAVFDIEPLAD
jgi:anti-sigma B factor antagonist